MNRMRLIGLDWSTEELKRGIAAVDLDEGGLNLVHLDGCSNRRSALDAIVGLLNTDCPVLIAIDAPLGWPLALSAALIEHQAGEPLGMTPAEMFSRSTDRFVEATIGKRPLEVGANFIARSAHSAVKFLGDLRQRAQIAVPLVWSIGELEPRRVGVIEVYPAATAKATGATDPHSPLGLPPATAVCRNEHVGDALWCVLTAIHFVRSECHPPSEPDVARREGWIWFPKKVAGEKRPPAEMRIVS